MKLQTFKQHSWLAEELGLLTEGVPSAIMNTYTKFLAGKDGKSGYTDNAPYAVQACHLELMTVWYCLDFHWDDNRPWKATDKGKAIQEKVMKNLKHKSNYGGGLTNYHVNDSWKNCIDVWNSIFENKDNKKDWGVPKNYSLGFIPQMYVFDLDKQSNPYGDICKSKSPLRGDGFYQDMFLKKKMIVKAKPGDAAL